MVLELARKSNVEEGKESHNDEVEEEWVDDREENEEDWISLGLIRKLWYDPNLTLMFLLPLTKAPGWLNMV